MVSPVMPDAKSDDRKAAVLPTSSMVTFLPIGFMEETYLSKPLIPPTPAAASVFIGPADTAFTLIPTGPRSAARNLTTDSKLALAGPVSYTHLTLPTIYSV